MAQQTKTSLTTRKGYDALIGHFYNNWTNQYGGNISNVLKPFTTQSFSSGLNSIPGSSFVARYYLPFLPTGTFNGHANANSLGLNPYGPYTMGQSIVSGSGSMPQNINTYMDPLSVRTFGIKAPATLVGWGYDLFGYPAPNLKPGWTDHAYLIPSGQYGPDNNFQGSGITSVSSGCFVPSEKWMAGPVDLRWDNFRKVWTGQYGVWSGRILKTYIDGVLTGGGPSQAAFTNQITYDAEIFDGVAGSIVVTGIRPACLTTSGSFYGSYKIIPWDVNQPCIVQTVYNGVVAPRLGITCAEVPAAIPCTGTTQQLGGSIIVANPDTDAGGTASISLDVGQTLIGNGTGLAPSPATLTAGTGITIISSSGSIIINCGLRKYEAVLASGNSLFNISHNLGTRGIHCSLYQAVSPYRNVTTSGIFDHITTSLLSVTFPYTTVENYNIVVIG